MPTGTTMKGAGVYVLDSARTPFGRYGGALAGVRPDDLAAHVLRVLLQRNADLDPASVDEVVLGNANGAGEENRNVARMAALLAGMPTSVPGVTVNRLCGSSMEAAIQGYRQIALGEAGVVLAGGVESMTRSPWVLPKAARPFPTGDAELVSTTLGWRLVNPAMPQEWTISLGASAEHLADLHGISREEQDEFAVRSHRLAAAAWDGGVHAEDVVPVPGTDLVRDEAVRPGTTVETLAGLKPAFRAGGTVTAGNSSPLTDGASAVLLAGEEATARLGVEPLARLVASASSACDPQVFGTAPVEAANRALTRAGIGWDDLALVDLNEAFAAQSLACLRGWPDLDPEKLNRCGGAIALGHPLGASGTRLIGTLARQLRARGGGWGLATLCIGVGQGLAVVLHA
ncbi:acetyl-CoA acyltransferase [Kineococcus xinjiangensis]|uniref:Probable acetyl-CoA acetyltransferase n=1 Tax=Kineococcus xinjiangensis TaxID=512762 RepID=A0A2S6IP66_9ACTN|nr:thiolase family protein [Kineococcus xinjiangensis]PPK96019.1 acetyl-CoA acyltransferase [Kineococcus xinjiangensis]